MRVLPGVLSVALGSLGLIAVVLLLRDEGMPEPEAWPALAAVGLLVGGLMALAGWFDPPAVGSPVPAPGRRARGRLALSGLLRAGLAVGIAWSTAAAPSAWGWLVGGVVAVVLLWGAAADLLAATRGRIIETESPTTAEPPYVLPYLNKNSASGHDAD